MRGQMFLANAANVASRILVAPLWPLLVFFGYGTDDYQVTLFCRILNLVFIVGHDQCKITRFDLVLLIFADQYPTAFDNIHSVATRKR